MKRKFNLMLLLVIALSVTAVLTSPALALENLSVDIGKNAKLVDGGQAVELKVKTVCVIEGAEVLEAFVYVTQNGNESQFAPIAVSCSGVPRPQKSTVRVPALDFVFQEGDANSSAYVLVIDPSTGVDYSAGSSESIHIR